MFNEDSQEYGAMHLHTCHSELDYPDFQEAANQNEGKEVILRTLKIKVLLFRFLVKVNIIIFFCSESLFLSEISSSLPWRNCFSLPFQICDLKWCHGQYTSIVIIVDLGVGIFHNLRTIFPFHSHCSEGWVTRIWAIKLEPVI